MKKNKNSSTGGAELRRQAEERLRANKTERAPARTKAESQRLLHELEVHQIELEMQNEELQQSRAEVEAGLTRYTNLYDFAPVGYFTLGRDGAIRQVNLTGARLLVVERSRLASGRFGLFVSEADRPAFNTFLRNVFESQAKETCEVKLLREGNRPPSPKGYGEAGPPSPKGYGEAGHIYARIEAAASEDGQECRAVVVDITEHKRTEETLKKSVDKYRILLENVKDLPTDDKTPEN